MQIQNTNSRKKILKGRPDYYITPTRNFTQYTRDSEQKYWIKDTKFDWNQNILHNLKENLENLEPKVFSKILFMVLPMIEDSLERRIVQIREEKLPLEEDALKDIGESIPFDRTAIQQVLVIQSPLKNLELPVSKFKDQLEILNSEFLDLREQQRLGFFRIGTIVKLLETDAEKKEQILELSRLTDQIDQLQKEYKQLKTQNIFDSEKIKINIREELNLIEPQILIDLEETQLLVCGSLTHI